MAWRRRLSAGVKADILSTFCEGFMVQCVVVFLLFDCFVCRLKRFTRYGHFTCEVGDTIIARLSIVS